MAQGCGYTAGQEAPSVAVNSVLRAGHTAKEKTRPAQESLGHVSTTNRSGHRTIGDSSPGNPAGSAMETGEITRAVEQEQQNFMGPLPESYGAPEICQLLDRMVEFSTTKYLDHRV